MTNTVRKRRIVLIAYVIVLFAITLAPLPEAPDIADFLPFLGRLARGLDKLAHAAAFGGLVLLLYWTRGWGAGYRVAAWVLALSIALAALIELAQSPLPYRSGDVWDFAAGGAGALATAAILTAVALRAGRPSPPGGGSSQGQL